VLIAYWKAILLALVDNSWS